MEKEAEEFISLDFKGSIVLLQKRFNGVYTRIGVWIEVCSIYRIGEPGRSI